MADRNERGEALHPGAIAHPATWPPIHGLDDVRNKVEPGRGIHFFEHGPFVIGRYTSSLPDTFRTAMDLECRGLVFDARSGALLSRTFHKFFNLGERQALDDLDFSAGARLEEKRDGSMIGAFVHEGGVIYHTRGGPSSQADAAGRAADRGHEALIREAFGAGLTPIFEYTSPGNRVVIAYDRPALVLLALRERVSGRYRDDIARDLCARHGVPMARTLSSLTGPDDPALATIAERDDIEGGVLVFPDGHRVKVKTRDYTRRHRILANIANERHAYAAWVEDVADDTAAALGGARGRALLDFMARIEARVGEICAELAPLADELGNLPGRDRAEIIRARYSGALQAVAFAAVAGDDPRGRIRDFVAKRLSDPAKREALKSDLDLPDWTVDILSLE